MRIVINCALICCLIAIGSRANAQATKTAKDSTNASDSAKMVKTALFKMDTVLSILRSKNDEKEKVGVIQFDNQKPISIFITSQHIKKRTGRSLLVDSAVLVIKDGYISDAQLFSGNRKFSNEYSPIPLTSKRFSRIDYLQNSTNSNEFIILQEALSFISYNSYFADDGVVTLTPGPTTKFRILEKNVGVNTVFDLRLYTDALGVLGQSSNGLVQTDARVKQYLHRKNVIRSGMFFGQYVKLFFNASKFDSKNGFEDSSNFTRTGLMQKAYLTGEFSLNLVNDWIEKKSLSTWYLDVGVGFSSSKLARSKDTISVTMSQVFCEAGLNLKISSNIGVDVYTRCIVQYSPQTDFESKDGAAYFLRSGGEVYWSPFGGDKANRLFARMNFTFPFDNAEKKAQYSQVQIGYSILLSKLGAKNGN